MLILLGFAIVIFSVFGGYVMSGGYLGPLLQPFEFVMIGGAALGGFVASNNGKAIKATISTFGRLKRTSKYNQTVYLELMAVQYKLLNKIRRDGMMGVERDIENPQESPIFSEHPIIMEDPMMMGFLTDYLRLMVSGSTDPFELDELMLHEIETFEQEAHIPVDALNKVAEGLPAFGIVAAVMGVVKALSASDISPDLMGEMIAHALVGTFLGILMGYGFVGPLASRLERQADEAVKVLQCIRVTLLASLNGSVPQLAVEFGRKTLSSTERPSFAELEEYVRSASEPRQESE